jgi:hypothetical protein
VHGRLGGSNGGPRDALCRRCIVGIYQVCVGFVVVLVGEGMCIGLSCCGMVDGVEALKMEICFSPLPSAATRPTDHSTTILS